MMGDAMVTTPWHHQCTITSGGVVAVGVDGAAWGLRAAASQGRLRMSGPGEAVVAGRTSATTAAVPRETTPPALRAVAEEAVLSLVAAEVSSYIFSICFGTSMHSGADRPIESSNVCY